MFLRRQVHRVSLCLRHSISVSGAGLVCAIDKTNYKSGIHPKFKRRYLTWLGLISLIVAVIWPVYSAADTLNVRVNRWLEIQQMSGDVTYLSGNSTRSARRGDRLQTVGDGVRTGSDSAATIAVDTRIGTVEVAELTSLKVKTLEVTPNDGHITRLQVDQGRVRLQVRSFTNPESELEIETPAGVSGVRGTEFGINVSPSGKMGVATLAGNVATAAQGQTVEVPAGFQNVTLSGEPPSQPVAFTNEPRLDYQVDQINWHGVRRVVLQGQVDPTSSVLVRGKPQEIDRNGRFRLLFPVPSRLRLEVTVVTPLGREQTYDLELI
jgi:hypothetical protein